ncbi:NADPH-dependent F420 reductase [Aestuariicella hydrocarbonica]|uniref:NADPH-dependent F420 reductase n=1 Tax=Pseudomaricurvus hydrocarbonicus TaxID=1470433 RepID=A0A9E5MHK0_9GAMM|nr:NADPH-dependent F420 reductase [Aestuariicella hydrocarbonica]NHO66021.1 NADPH-dependent F420 reductase [Aestuariicella hydrocarbonica]
MQDSKHTLIGVVGGTGKLGEALARRWIKAGHPVMIGSRTADKAMTTAAALNQETDAVVTSGSNADVAEKADLIVITVPFSAQAETLNDICNEVQGKIVVDTTVPLMPPKVMRVQLPAEGCAALKAQKILGEGVRLVSAFHSVAAHRLATDDDIACDIMVFGDDKAAREQVVTLANDAGLRGIHAGALVNSVAAEALTSILIFVNKTYSVDGAGIQFTGDLTL